MDRCDMCGSQIENGKCSCGTWTTPEENINNPFKISLEKFHEMKTLVTSMDTPHLGCAAVFFRGDYNDCQVIVNYIKKIKKRPFYKEDEA